MDRQIDGEIGGYIDLWIDDGQIAEQIDGKIDRYTADGWRDGLTYGKIESYIYRQTCGQMDVDGQIDRWRDRWIHRQMDK